MAAPSRADIQQALAGARSEGKLAGALGGLNLAHHIHAPPACTAADQQASGSCGNAACASHPGNEITCVEVTVPVINVKVCSCWHHSGKPQPSGG